MQDIKQQPTNEQIKQLIDTDNSMVVTTGGGGWVGDKESKRGQIYSDGRRLDFGW